MNKNKTVITIITILFANIFEWLDFIMYGAMGPIVSEKFYPKASHSEYASLLVFFGVFAAGYVIRPCGAFVFGVIGDKYGRKISLISSVILMMIATISFGFLPTFDTFGIFALVLLILCRLCQGLSVGGQLGSSTLLIESAPPNRRGLVGGLEGCSICVGIMLGSLSVAACSYLFSPEDLNAWGWRIPFIFGGLVGGISGLYVKLHATESAAFLRSKSESKLSKTPMREVFEGYKMKFIISAGMHVMYTSSLYSLIVFINTFVSVVLKQDLGNTLVVNSIVMTMAAVVGIYAGHLSDKIGPKLILIVISVLFLFAGVPLFFLLSQNTAVTTIIVQTILACMMGIAFGPAMRTSVEIFPTRIRYTAVAVSRNLSVTLFGGTAPAISMWLLHITKLSYAPGFYLMFCACLSLLALYFFEDRYNQPLLED